MNYIMWIICSLSSLTFGVLGTLLLDLFGFDPIVKMLLSTDWFSQLGNKVQTSPKPWNAVGLGISVTIVTMISLLVSTLHWLVPAVLLPVELVWYLVVTVRLARRRPYSVALMWLSFVFGLTPFALCWCMLIFQMRHAFKRVHVPYTDQDVLISPWSSEDRRLRDEPQSHIRPELYPGSVYNPESLDGDVDVRAPAFRKAVPFEDILYPRTRLYDVRLRNTVTDDGASVTVTYCYEAYLDAFQDLYGEVEDGTITERGFNSVRRRIIGSPQYNLPQGMDSWIKANSVRIAREMVLLHLEQHNKLFADSVNFLNVYSHLKRNQRFMERLRIRSPHRFYMAIITQAMVTGATVGLGVWRYGYIYGARGALHTTKIPELVSVALPNLVSVQPMRNATQHAIQVVGRTVPVWFSKIFDGICHAVSYSFFAHAEDVEPYFNPKADFMSSTNAALGLNLRVNTYHQIDPIEMENFRLFVKKERPMKPVSSLLPFRQWLDDTHYSAKRKAEISKIYDLRKQGPHKFFVKDESSVKCKAPRIIMNVDQYYKNLEGPVVAAMTRSLHDFPEVLAGYPVDSWPTRVMEGLKEMGGSECCNVFVTDYSSFESSFGLDLKNAVENPCIDEFLSNFPSLAKYLRDEQSSQRIFKRWTKNGTITFDAPPLRASGDQRTYLGNTLTNIMVLRYVFRDVPHRCFCCGDDGILILPKCVDINQYLPIWARLGLTLKLQPCTIGTSGFCGFTFNEDNLQTRVCADPLSACLDIISVSRKMRKETYYAYIRARACSYLHEYPNDPVLAPAMNYVIAHYPNKEVPLSWWDKRLLGEGFDVNDYANRELETMRFSSQISGMTEEDLTILRDVMLEVVRTRKLTKLSIWARRFDETYGNKERLWFNSLRPERVDGELAFPLDYQYIYDAICGVESMGVRSARHSYPHFY